MLSCSFIYPEDSFRFPGQLNLKLIAKNFIMFLPGLITVVFALARGILAQSHISTPQQTTTNSPSALPTELLSSPSILDCMASMRCDERAALGEFSIASCKYPTTECQCVAWNSTGYADCLKDKCPDNWQC